MWHCEIYNDTKKNEEINKFLRNLQTQKKKKKKQKQNKIYH